MTLRLRRATAKKKSLQNCGSTSHSGVSRVHTWVTPVVAGTTAVCSFRTGRHAQTGAGSPDRWGFAFYAQSRSFTVLAGLRLRCDLYVTGVPTETELREQGHARTTTRWHGRMTGRATIVIDDDCPVNHQFRETPCI